MADLKVVYKREKVNRLTVKGLIKLLLRTNFKHSLKIKDKKVHNFKLDEDNNKLYLLTDDNHNFLLNSSKIKTVTDFINALLDVNLDAIVYYNDLNVLDLYNNAYLSVTYVIVTNDEVEEIHHSSYDMLKLFTDNRSYYKNLLRSLNGISTYVDADASIIHDKWDDLLDT